jgi:hypothetical protein
MAESANENRTVYRLRWVGYALLLFALIDTIALLIPPEFTNPLWELQTIGQMVERVVVPLLGFALVFFAEFHDRTQIEKWVLRILSWLCLLLAVVFLLMIPLGVMNSMRINSQAQQAVSTQVNQRLQQLDVLEKQLNQSGPEDIQKLAAQLASQGIQVDAQNPEKLKADVLTRLKAAREQLKTQVQAGQSDQQKNLFKNAVKWNLGALIASVLFFILWRSTDWAR